MTYTNSQKGEVLISYLKDQRDLGILQDQSWYRIPISQTPKDWLPPKYLAFYQPKVFQEDAFQISYFGRVREIEVVTRLELLPDEPNHPHSNHQYHKIILESVERLPRPIVSLRWRRICFIPTTWNRFQLAKEINDLYAGSPLEELLWIELKARQVEAEREYEIQVKESAFRLDFAVLCENGDIDIETDGDVYHAFPEQARRDNKRNNLLTSAGWRILRFSTREVRERMNHDCMPIILETISNLGGVKQIGKALNPYYVTPKGTRKKRIIYEEQAEYNLD